MRNLSTKAAERLIGWLENVEGANLLNKNARLPYKTAIMRDRLKKVLPLLDARSLNQFYRLVLAVFEPRNQSEVQDIRATDGRARKSVFFEHMADSDVTCYLPADILVKVDRAAMFNSLETRTPYLDHAVIDLANQMPFWMKVNKDMAAKLLLRCFWRETYLGTSSGQKEGFSVPLAAG